jgi:hypothetical protein
MVTDVGFEVEAGAKSENKVFRYCISTCNIPLAA